jgi:predicted Zn finger-like uncharacterized protein
MSTGQRFEIPCPGCGTQVAVSTAHIGKKGRCPECKTVFPIVAPEAPIVAEVLPSRRSEIGGQRLAVGGLQPLPHGLQPMPPGLQPLSPGLQPLQPMGYAQPSPYQQPAWQNSALPNPYGASAPSQPFGQPSPFGQPAASAGPSLFDDFGKTKPKPVDDELQLAPDSNPYASPHDASHVHETLKRVAENESWRKTQARGELNASMWGGIGMMAFAAVWFFAGLFLLNVIFLYSPILFCVGLVAFFRGLFSRPES